MAEYIELEVAITKIRAEGTLSIGYHSDKEVEDDIVDMLERLPAEDVAPVVHGHWCLEEYEFFNCSVCGGSYYTGAESTEQAKSYLSSGNTYAYCPSCGAKMEEAR